MNEQYKKEMLEHLAYTRHENWFGDGQEDDMVWHGHNVKGLFEMSDEEILEEYEQQVMKEDELLCKVKFDIQVEKELGVDMTIEEENDRVPQVLKDLLTK